MHGIFLFIVLIVLENVFRTGVLCTVPAHDKGEPGTWNLRRDLQRVSSTYVCVYNVHEIMASHKVRGDLWMTCWHFDLLNVQFSHSLIDITRPGNMIITMLFDHITISWCCHLLCETGDLSEMVDFKLILFYIRSKLRVRIDIQWRINAIMDGVGCWTFWSWCWCIWFAAWKITMITFITVTVPPLLPSLRYFHHPRLRSLLLVVVITSSCVEWKFPL